jgi:hypothetical protein
VLRPLDVVPLQYHAALWLGAGQGCRFGEGLGLEDSPRCFNVTDAELHVTHQLRYDTQAYGGFYLKEQKRGSAGTIQLDEGPRSRRREDMDILEVLDRLSWPTRAAAHNVIFIWIEGWNNTRCRYSTLDCLWPLPLTSQDHGVD